MTVLNCPHCGKANDTHDGPGRADTPQAGDASICWGCRDVAVFVILDGRLGLRLPTAEERAEIDASPQIREARAALAESYTPRQASELRWGSP